MRKSLWIYPPPNNGGLYATLIRDAQKHFNSSIDIITQNYGTDKSNPKTTPKSPNWKKAYVKQSKGGESIVVIPLNETVKLYYEQSGKFIDLEGKRFVYMYHSKDGSMTTEVVTMLPDEKCLASNKNGVPFSGKIIVEEWGGKFIKAYRFTGNKIYHARSVS